MCEWYCSDYQNRVLSMTPCECPLPGFCVRHNVRKNLHAHRLCQTSTKYFGLWEAGKGPGQIQPIVEKNIVFGVKGVGTIIHERLAKLGIHDVSGCSCTSHRSTLNAWGPRVCRENINTIVSWMAAEANKRSLPFSRVMARTFVEWCIRKAEKLSEK